MLPTTKTPPKKDLADLTVLQYGRSKSGKSEFCSHAENALFLATEPGLNALEVFQMPIETWEDMLSACGEIAQGGHPFKTVIVDTVDNAYRMCSEHICHKFKIEHESDLGYGKGWALINNEFHRVLTKLAFLPYGLFLVSHSQEIEVETRTGKYTRTVPTLPDKARKLVLGMVDIKSNTDTVLEMPSLPGTLGPGRTTRVSGITDDLLRALELGLLWVPGGAEGPGGLPPVVFEHHYPKVLPVAASRAYYVRVLRGDAAFHDGTALRNFVAYYGDGAGMSCAFSDDGITWDGEKEITGIAVNGYHVVCVKEAATRMRILYWDPDVPSQPYNMDGLRTAVCNPQGDASVFFDDTVCTGNIVTEGATQVWNRGHYGPSFVWYNEKPTSMAKKPCLCGITRSRRPWRRNPSLGDIPCISSPRPEAMIPWAWRTQTTRSSGSSMGMGQ